MNERLPKRNVTRRTALAALACALGATPAILRAGEKLPNRRGLGFGTTAVFLDDQVSLLERWKEQLTESVGEPIYFVTRGSYREIVELLMSEQIDIAWVCGFPYVRYAPRMRLMAVPQYNGQPLYRSHLIVPKTDLRTNHITQLGGRIYAFSDPGSNSGYLVPTTELIRARVAPNQFFKKSFFTFAHSKVVEAVSVGLADAGSVDGYVWDTLDKQLPEQTKLTRVAWRSPEYGFPPIVARPGLSADTFARLQHALVTMGESTEGREMLVRLNLDAFVKGSDQLFDGIRGLVGILSSVPGQT
jgi:phosphonate transport system substrate-binding protein